MINSSHQRKGKNLNSIERGQIEAYLSQGLSIYKISKIMNRKYDTIAREVKRGTSTLNLSNKKVYIAQKGQEMYNIKNRNRGRYAKIQKDKYKRFIEYIENEYKRTGYGINAIRSYAIKNKLFNKNEIVCTTTLYSYIDRGYMNIKNIDLPSKVTRRMPKHKPPRINKKIYGTSIEKRNKTISNRNTFGHWEIDTVIGKKTKNENVLLVLTERKTRKEIIRKIDSKTANSVMIELNKILNEYESNFNYIFKTITADNGAEFSKLKNIERKGIKIYFAHPYSSFERGSNERNNRIIRQFIQKGKSINKYTQDNIKQIQEWINNMPREILGFKTANEMFIKEIKKAAPIEFISTKTA